MEFLSRRRDYPLQAHRSRPRNHDCCAKPTTFQAIIIWRDELNEGKVLLRDIIDLDATFAGPEAKKIDRSAEGAAPPHSDAISETEGEPDEVMMKPKSILLSAMEMELKPKVGVSMSLPT